MPAGLSREIQNLVNPEIPFKVLLRDFIEKNAHSDYSWEKLDPSYMQRGLLIPSLYSEELPEVAIAVDTSYSTTSWLDRFAAEVSGVLQAYKTTAHIIYCDAEVHGEEIVESDDLPLNLSPKGGGGTSFVPVFEHCQKQQYEPCCMIFFTDLDGRFPEKEPPYPVLWVVPESATQYGTKEPPFGSMVVFKG